MPLHLFLRRLLRRNAYIDNRMQLLRGRWLSRGAGYPDWKQARMASPDDWRRIEAAAGEGAKILIATSIGAHLAAMQMETVLATALKARGAEVHALLCDKLLPGCQMCEPRFIPDAEHLIKHGPQRDICGHCHEPGRRVFEAADVPVHAYSSTLTETDRELAAHTARAIPLREIERFTFDGLHVGEHAKAGALRFFARATIDEEPLAEPVLRRYLEAAMLTALSVRALFQERRFDVAVFHHGIYVPQGIIGEVARQMGVRVVTWHPAYRRGCFIFSHDDTYHHTLMNEPTEYWENMPWSSEREEAITSYLRSRWQGTNDWIKFVGDPEFQRDRILAEIGCDLSRPIIACLTNVMWDAQLHYPANAFPNMLEWLLYTVRYFAGRPDLQLVIRVHPAEIRGSVPSRQPVADELSRYFPELPENVFVVGPESSISTYVLAELSDAAIIYGTKTGVELTSEGIPVIVAGEAWIRGKGITVDAESIDSYRAALDRLPYGRRLDREVVIRARRYAYHFFCRRMIPVQLFEPNGMGWPPYQFSAPLDKLLPGQEPGLDLVCRGIIEGAPFIYDEESGGLA